MSGMTARVMVMVMTMAKDAAGTSTEEIFFSASPGGPGGCLGGEIDMDRPPALQRRERDPRHARMLPRSLASQKERGSLI